MELLASVKRFVVGAAGLRNSERCQSHLKNESHYSRAQMNIGWAKTKKPVPTFKYQFLQQK